MNKFSHNHYLKQATGKDSIVESIYSRGTTQQIPEPKKPFLPLNRGNSFFEQYFEQNPLMVPNYHPDSPDEDNFEPVEKLVIPGSAEIEP